MDLRLSQTPIVHQTNAQLAKAHSIARQIVAGSIPAPDYYRLHCQFIIDRIRAEYQRRIELIKTQNHEHNKRQH